MSLINIFSALAKGHAPISTITGSIDFTNSVIVCDGNSLTAGYQSTNPATKSYPAVLQTLSPFSSDGTTVTNKGVSAQTTNNMIADATTDIDPLFNASVSSLLIAWEMGNDLYFSGSVSGAETRFQSYCQSRKAVGWDVVVITSPARDHSIVNGGFSPFGDSDAQYDVKRKACNDWLRLNYPSFSIAIVDLDADARLQTYNTTYFFSDHVHLNDTGYALVASLVQNVLVNATI